ncbi:hypothetical protein BSCH_01050c [Candidatus Paraburkholderia schumanniana]|nr:hypothetical protein BSCH_01050c [Candidatus Paraburkholderia schumannianae]
MFENTSLDQFSALDDFASVTPVWRPFVQHAPHAPATEQESQQQNGECSH